MDEYYETFVTKGFDLETDLQFLTSTDLDELGITVPEHRRVLLAAGRPNSFSNNYIHCVRGMCNYGQWIFKSERDLFYLTTHSTHFIYGYLASGIWLRTILIVRKETRCRHIVYSYRLTARVLLYAPSHRQDNTYHSLCYTSRGKLAGTRNSSMRPPHEGSIRQPIAP